MLENIAAGLSGALQFTNIIVSIVGMILGIVVGALPGVGPAMSIAVLVPITFGMDPAAGLLLLVSLYIGAVYGGSITSILLRIPGEPVSIPAMWEGNAMAKEGRGGEALRLAVAASVIGGTLSALSLLFFAPILGQVAIEFGPPEYVALTVMGLAVIASLESRSVWRGVLITLFGLFVGTIGLDPAAGVPRFTFGSVNLFDGFNIVAILIGVFALPELADMVAGPSMSRLPPPAEGQGEKVGLRRIARLARPIGRGSLLGILIGAIPGAGGTVATFIAYDDAKRRSKEPEKFGKGSEEGLVAAESCNNGSVQASLIPLLTLGIPGSAAAAVFLGALTIHGLRPGPLLFTQESEIVYTFLVGALLAQIWLYLAGRYGARLWARAAGLHKGILVPTITIFAVLGAYALRNNFFDVWAMLGFGILGVGMHRLGLSRAAFILAVILGPIFESNLVRSLAMSRNDPLILVQRPVAIGIYVLTAAMIYGSMRQKRQIQLQSDEEVPG